MDEPRAVLDWDVICFGSVDWDSHDQRPQAIMRALAKRGATITYVDNLGLRLPRPRDLTRAARRLKNWTKNRHGPVAGRDAGIAVRSPVILPLHHVRPVEAHTLRVLERGVGTERVGGRRRIVWTYLPLPVISRFAARLGADACIYDWADDLSQRLLSPSRRQRNRIARWEDLMSETSDLVFVASEELLRRRRPSNPETAVVPHGIDRAITVRMDSASDVGPFPSPRIGFVGSISEWIDLDLIDAMAEARPSWSFVLVGPSHLRANRLPQRPNIHHLGRRDQGELARYYASFDAAIIPYRPAPAISAASPLKLREYLAHGLPVVSVDIPEVHPFVPPVEVASGPTAFVQALERGLVRGRGSTEDPRTWDDVADEMVARIHDVL